MSRLLEKGPTPKHRSFVGPETTSGDGNTRTWIDDAPVGTSIPDPLGILPKGPSRRTERATEGRGNARGRKV